MYASSSDLLLQVWPLLVVLVNLGPAPASVVSRQRHIYWHHCPVVRKAALILLKLFHPVRASCPFPRFRFPLSIFLLLSGRHEAERPPLLSKEKKSQQPTLQGYRHGCTPLQDGHSCVHTALTSMRSRYWAVRCHGEACVGARLLCCCAKTAMASLVFGVLLALGSAKVGSSDQIEPLL